MTPLDVAAGAGVLIGALLQSAVGFGFALVCAPLIFAAAGPLPAVGLLTALGLEVNLLSLLGERRRPRPLVRTVLVVLAWSLPGMLAGVYVLRSVGAAALQILVTVTVFVSLAVRHVSPDHDRPAPPWGPGVAGLASGALTTATATAGPPLVLLLLGRGHAPARVRDTLTVSFAALSALAVGALAVTGTRGALPHAAALAALLPLAAAGQLLGRPLFHRLASGRYELALTVVLCVSAAVGLASALL